MPAPTDAGLRRDGDALVFSGPLSRAQVPALWKQAHALADGARRIDVGAVAGVDSAGLALLVEVAALAGGGVAVAGDPPGLSDLRAAYRLDETLTFAA